MNLTLSQSCALYSFGTRKYILCLYASISLVMKYFFIPDMFAWVHWYSCFGVSTWSAVMYCKLVLIAKLSIVPPLQPHIVIQFLYWDAAPSLIDMICSWQHDFDVLLKKSYKVKSFTRITCCYGVPCCLSVFQVELLFWILNHKRMILCKV